MSTIPSSLWQPSQEIGITAPLGAGYDAILSAEALRFITELERLFGGRRRELLKSRAERQRRLDAGELPDFLQETTGIRQSAWRVRPAPADLQDRRVEITGPVDRKLLINALNSGAKCFMADLEDAHSPTWEATVEGQINLRDAVARTLTYTSPEGKAYRLNDRLATLIIRPRGWHLEEKHVLVDGRRISAALFDFGLYLLHNAQALLGLGSGPYFYLPKLESHREARLWRDVFSWSEARLGLEHGTIRCTVLIETITAVFEMDEILYELREYICGLNCGRWDYIFSFIKRFRAHPGYVLPDRSQVTMSAHFLRAYSKLLINTCHRRGAHAMGGMAAQIPIRDDSAADVAAKEKVRLDKEREAGDGHDGTWVAHPGLVPVAMAVFDRRMPAPNQLDRIDDSLQVSASDLLRVPQGEITEAGMRNNISAALRYLAAWLGGRGAVPIHHLMEDAATAEIARSQIWQWIRYPKGVFEDGRKITYQHFDQAVEDELEQVRREVAELAFESGHYQQAAQLLRKIVADDDFEEFLTLPAYEQLA
ncbi:MAG: malate synthase A [Candidatus Thiodiazotropha sp. (ex Epidulcina cf. delphinae)]|nr:malate synthase A [Candidatus Thiodiazotropha sp. (ex Epidulcina cf. delphinae)]